MVAQDSKYANLEEGAAVDVTSRPPSILAAIAQPEAACY
jgi:hypothetical protein